MSFTNTLLQLFFPERCIGCRRFDTPLCDTCIRVHTTARWTPLPDTGIPYLKSALTLGEYADHFWQRAVGNLKFHQQPRLAVPLGSTLAQHLRQQLLFGSGAPVEHQVQNEWVCVGVPLHPRRERERGYNQSTLLAREVAQHLGTTAPTTLLERARYTHTQTTLTDEARWQNVGTAFTIRPALINSTEREQWMHRSWIIVDDVITTGATILSVARALGPLQPRTVHLCALARSTIHQ